MTRSGKLYRLPTLERPTFDSGMDRGLLHMDFPRMA